tara:strand:+ start:166 stop:297 length:132 start_codon:yes stop_codon:yes gene_type:complete
VADIEKCKNGHEFPKHFEMGCSECITLKMSKMFKNKVKIKGKD